MAKMDKETRDRVKGALWGLIVGDAFGSPIQFTEKDNHKHITKMEPCLIFNMPKGAWTDDGSMALCIMQAAIDAKGLPSATQVADEFLKWNFDGKHTPTGKAFDQGGATLHGLYEYRRTGSVVNGDERTQGNGSIMRLAPAYFLERFGRIYWYSEQISDLTHASEVVRDYVRRMGVVLNAHMGGLCTTIQSQFADREQARSTGWVVDTFHAALWAFNGSTDFYNGLEAVVNLGGDSDTAGAVYGQIAGAYYGFHGIPTRLIRDVMHWRHIDVQIERFIRVLERL